MLVTRLIPSQRIAGPLLVKCQRYLARGIAGCRVRAPALRAVGLLVPGRFGHTRKNVGSIPSRATMTTEANQSY